MNKLSLFIFIVSMGLFACGEATTDRNGTAADEQKTQTEQQKDRSVEQIINHQVEKLDEKMSLSTENKRQIKTIYTNSYLAQGGSLNDRIEQDDISNFRIQMVAQTENEVLVLLDENQRLVYKQLFEEK